ncbi:lytic transglycosylase domain-containing protein [Saccharibacter floricola]|uniref:Transglycosylase SLT domain-containing protein n=1 Tax=Saccharibacter floricola DSM 15669 TaxID=1123227 RepID=A0ABQ0NZN4_9PROT|nr:lytic transglycosylase domain-containing protein [Saccharibacter floricola]GBQ07524.1 hypothetical protein AA15669_1419 [Saccharibacter floricola DSM 15669]
MVNQTSVIDISVQYQEFLDYIEAVERYRTLLKESGEELSRAVKMPHGASHEREKATKGEASATKELVTINQSLVGTESDRNKQLKEGNRQLTDRKRRKEEEGRVERENIRRVQSFARSPLGKIAYAAVAMKGVQLGFAAFQGLQNIAHSGAALRAQSLRTRMDASHIKAWQNNLEPYDPEGSLMQAANRATRDAGYAAKLRGIGVDTSSRDMNKILASLVQTLPQFERKHKGDNEDAIWDGRHLSDLQGAAISLEQAPDKEVRAIPGTVEANAKEAHYNKEALTAAQKAALNDRRRQNEAEATKLNNFAPTIDKAMGEARKAQENLDAVTDSAGRLAIQLDKITNGNGLLALAGIAAIAPTLGGMALKKGFQGAEKGIRALLGKGGKGAAAAGEAAAEEGAAAEGAAGTATGATEGAAAATEVGATIGSSIVSVLSTALAGGTIAGATGWAVGRDVKDNGYSPFDPYAGTLGPHDKEAEKKQDDERTDYLKVFKHYQDRTGAWTTWDFNEAKERQLMGRDDKRPKTPTKAPPPTLAQASPRPDKSASSSSALTHVDGMRRLLDLTAGILECERTLVDQKRDGNAGPPMLATSTMTDTPARSSNGAAAPTLAETGGQAPDLDRLTGAVAMAESGGNPNAVSRVGAKGLLQLMPATAREYGVTNPFDPLQSWRGGEAMLARLRRKYHGDTEKTLAAYNMGSGNLDRDIRERGANWKQGLPKETTDYIPRVLQNLSRGTVVKIENYSGQNIAVSSRQGAIL